MSDWSTLEVNFNPFGPLQGPVQSTLQIFETVEAVLEALLDLVRAFLLDLTNPVAALISLLLAAIRAIINQLKSSGFNILLVHPDFSRQDIGAIFESVSGSYPAFESKVFNKFYDQADINRPQFPLGSAVALLALYIGTDSPGDLLTQLFSLLNFLKHPSILTGIPAPVEVKISPVLQSGATVTQFSDLFASGYQKQLVVEWRMPTNPSGVNQPGFISHLTAFYNAFRFPQFVVERSITPTGEDVSTVLQTQIGNSANASLMTKYSFPVPTGAVFLRESNGNVYRNFGTKIPVSGATLADGFATGTYKFTDSDPNLTPGVVYYYRIRAYFGSPTTWLNTSIEVTGDPTKSKQEVQALTAAVQNILNSSLVKISGNQAIINYGNGIIMGQPSAVSKGFVPLPTNASLGYNAYLNVNDAIQAAVLLNFELPGSQPGDSVTVQNQKTGWGTLGMLGGQIGPLKKVFNDSQRLFSNLIFTTTCRRLANHVLSNIASNTALSGILTKKWNGHITESNGGTSTLSQVITKILGASGAANTSAANVVVGSLSPAGASDRPGPSISWKFPGVVGGITPANNATIVSYLALESTYISGNPLTGPLPLNTYTLTDPTVDYSVSVNERAALADFLRTCISVTASVNYLSWYAITVSDLFPAFIPFTFDFEQFMLSLLKATKSVVAEIEGIIDTLIQKIKQLEAILQTISQLIDLLNITIRVSLLSFSSTSGSSDTLAQALIQSGNKPTSSPFGLHSGIVMTFGGPGAGAIAAFQALGFIMNAGT